MKRQGRNRHRRRRHDNEGCGTVTKKKRIKTSEQVNKPRCANKTRFYLELAASWSEAADWKEPGQAP